MLASYQKVTSSRTPAEYVNTSELALACLKPFQPTLASRISVCLLSKEDLNPFSPAPEQCLGATKHYSQPAPKHCSGGKTRVFNLVLRGKSMHTQWVKGRECCFHLHCVFFVVFGSVLCSLCFREKWITTSTLIFFVYLSFSKCWKRMIASSVLIFYNDILDSYLHKCVKYGVGRLCTLGAIRLWVKHPLLLSWIAKNALAGQASVLKGLKQNITH